MTKYVNPRILINTLLNFQSQLIGALTKQFYRIKRLLRDQSGTFWKGNWALNLGKSLSKTLANHVSAIVIFCNTAPLFDRLVQKAAIPIKSYTAT